MRLMRWFRGARRNIVWHRDTARDAWEKLTGTRRRYRNEGGIHFNREVFVTWCRVHFFPDIDSEDKSPAQTISPESFDKTNE